jgi:pimeloyl-ACP methyl ester carboxylesterase
MSDEDFPVDSDATSALQVLPGVETSNRAVIAFGGILAMLGGISIGEFGKSLGVQAGGIEPLRRHVAFVRERPARWYNALDLMPVREHAALQQGRHVVTLGNSMGGFAAILFSLILPGVRRSISFCPQYSVHPDHSPFETRWRELVREIAVWRFETCLPPMANQLRPGLSHMLFCGQNEPADIRHAERIVAGSANPATAFLVAGCGHEVARRLKAADALAPLFDLLIDDDAGPELIAELLAARGISFSRIDNGC